MLQTYINIFVVLVMLMGSHCFYSLRLTPHLSQNTLASHRSVHKLHLMNNNLLLSAVEKADGYVYGAVSSPDWVLPLGAFLVILTAGIPILLKPGEEALDEQRENEEKTNNKFNKRKNKDLR